MVKIYLEFFNGEVVGWGSHLDGDAPIIEIELGHDFFNDPSQYEYVEGQIRKKVQIDG